MKLASIVTAIAASAFLMSAGAASAANLNAGSTLTFPPFEMMDGDKATGFEVELLEMLAKRAGYDGVEWTQVNFEGIIPGVATGKFEIAASGITGWAPPTSPALAVVKRRTEQVSFTTPHYLYPALIITDKDFHPEITSVDQLTAGMKVGVVDGTHIYFWAQDVLASKGVEVIAVKSGAQTYTQLQAGLIDALVDVRASANKAASTDDTLQLGDEVPALTGGYAFAVSPGNDALRGALSKALAEAVADGSYAQLFKKYFPDATVPELPTNAYPE
jgi:polar amino acid transport system substrate-binding protein